MTDERRKKNPEFALILGGALGIALGLLWKEMAVGVLVGAGIGLLLFSSRGRRSGRREEEP
jgi:purine-cytosine permease-like protein